MRKGNAVIAILLLLVGAAILGGGVYYVYSDRIDGSLLDTGGLQGVKVVERDSEKDLLEALEKWREMTSHRSRLLIQVSMDPSLWQNKRTPFSRLLPVSADALLGSAMNALAQAVGGEGEEQEDIVLFSTVAHGEYAADAGRANPRYDLEMLFRMNRIDPPDDFDQMGVNIRYVDSVLYVQPTELSESVESMIPADYVGSWFSLPVQEAREAATDLRGSEDEDVPQVKSQQQYSEEAMSAYRQHPFIQFRSVITGQTDRGAEVYKHLFSVDIERLQGFMEEVARAQDFSEHEIEEMQNDMQELFTMTGAINGEVWLDHDLLIHHFEFDIKMKDPEKGMSGSYLFAVDYWDHGEIIEIAAPDEHRDLMEAIMGAMMGSMIQAAGDADMDGLPDKLEKTFCTDPADPDTDGDGYPDGSEVENGYNPNGTGTLEEYMASDMCPSQSTQLRSEPGEGRANFRDEDRVNDIENLRHAINLYLVTVHEPYLCDAGVVYASTDIHAKNIEVRTGGREIDGSGWLPMDLTETAGGSPLQLLPIDPINDENFFYAFTCDPELSTYEFNTNMEGTLYAMGGEEDIESKDFGDNAQVYEIGNDIGVDLMPNEIWE